MYSIKKNKKPKRTFNEVVQLGIPGRKYFLGRTFSTKFFMRLCSEMVESSFICFTILNFEPENRKKEEIEKVIPWLKKLKYFYDFITLKETELTSNILLARLAWVLFRKGLSKNKIIKRNGENNQKFYLVLEGSALKLDLIISREILSLEEYLIYLIKMKILKEKEILNKCKILNKSFVELNEDSIKFFCEKNNIGQYDFMRKKAIKDLNELGFEINVNSQEDYFDINTLKIKSLESYLKIFYVPKDSKKFLDSKKAYFNFYIPYYKINGEMKKGTFFGNLLKDKVKNYSTYITKDKCDIGIINKDMHFSQELYGLIIKKKKKLFREFANDFFLFHHIDKEIFCNNYGEFIVYKKYYKGDKLFLQNSCYEGVFLLKSGEIQISIDTSIDEMYNLITYLTYALNGFNDYVSGFNFNEYISDQIKQQKKRVINYDTFGPKTSKLYLEINNCVLMSVKDYNIVGTNEAFDHQTGIYNFTAECISDEAIIYFLPKEILNIILNKEKMVYNSFIQLVEFRIKDIIWKIKNHINVFENKIKKMLKRTKTSENFIIDNNIKDNNNIINNSEKIKQSLEKNISGILKRSNLSYTKGLVKGNKNKNLFLSQDVNMNIIDNFRNIRNIYSLSDRLKMEKMNNNKKFRIIDEYNKINNKFLFPQKKEFVIKSIPNRFPYLIMDSFIKRNFIKDNKINLFPKIKTSNNLKTLKIKKLYLNNDKNNNNYLI